MMNINHVFQVFFLSFISFGCKSVEAAKSVCNQKVELQKDTRDNSKADKDNILSTLPSTAFAIHFIGKFNNDTLDVFINNTMKKINIDRPDDNDHKSYGLTFSDIDTSKTPILKIESYNDNDCLRAKLDWKYRLIYVWRENDKWIIRYSNFHSNDLKN